MSEHAFLAIPPLLIMSDEGRDFEVYVKLKKDFMLYAKGSKLSSKHKDILHQNDVKELYIKTDQRQTYEKYVEQNFSKILANKDIPRSERTRLLYEHGAHTVSSIYGKAFPVLGDPLALKRMDAFVEASFTFLGENKEAFGNLKEIISHSYTTYTHCIHVMAYSFFLLQALGTDPATLRKIGLGALLHDIGKTAIPSAILDKPGRLTTEEFEVIKTHPVKGMLICQRLNLPHISVNCVLFHHEKLDGQGYPGMATEIPEYVRALTIADIYDALVSERAYSKAYSPFEALRIMRGDVERGKLDKDIFTVFVNLLSESRLAA